MMKNPFGGEPPLNSHGYHRAFVHSGRAALRLLLTSGLKEKKILLPDYLCAVIVDVMRQYKVSYDFYHIKPDLTPDWTKLKGKRFDVLYVINYFGQKTKVPSGLLKKKTLLIDDVFAPDVEMPQGVQSWAVFNSLRKVTCLAEGAMIATSCPLKLLAIDAKPAAFAGLKYKAKQLKADYLAKGQGSQQGYVRAFIKAEAKLDVDSGIHVPGMMTLGLLPQIYTNIKQEQGIRRRQYRILDRQLRRYRLSLRPEYLSFYVLKTERRDALKVYLANQGIFLAAHWPVNNGLNNLLYEQILSIALDSRYSDAQMRTVAHAIRRFLK
jgi:hypothetical protein